MKPSSFVVLTLVCLSCILSETSAQWRPITQQEETFVQSVERKVHQILRDAANKMDRKWEIKIETDKFQRHELDDAEHRGRPHEVRVTLTMTLQPTEKELGEYDRRINEHGASVARFDPIPDAMMRTNPEHEMQIWVSLVVNYKGYMPRSKNGIVGLGYQTTVPGTFFSAMRWKELGTGAPIQTLYIGDFKWERRSGDQYIVESFGIVTDCRNARTVLIEVHSSEKQAESFSKKLNVAALNDLVASQ